MGVLCDQKNTHQFTFNRKAIPKVRNVFDDREAPSRSVRGVGFFNRIEDILVRNVSPIKWCSDSVENFQFHCGQLFFFDGHILLSLCLMDNSPPQKSKLGHFLGAGVLDGPGVKAIIRVFE